MNNVLLRQLVLTAEFQPLSAQPLVASVTLAAPPTNRGHVILASDDGSEVAWSPGEYYVFWHIDLSQLRAKGTAGDVLTIVGGTW